MLFDFSNKNAGFYQKPIQVVQASQDLKSLYFKTLSQNIGNHSGGKHNFGDFNFFQDQDIWGQENSPFVKLGNKNMDVIQISKILSS